MTHARTTKRVFTAQEREWFTAHYPSASYAEMSAHLRCSYRVLAREARLLGLTPRRQSKTVKAGDLRRKREYHTRGHIGWKNRSADEDGERESPPPEGTRYACPGCGTRALSPLGHDGCLEREQVA